MQVIADRLFTLAQRDQETPVVKVLFRDVQQCMHARTEVQEEVSRNNLRTVRQTQNRTRRPLLIKALPSFAEGSLR